MERLTNEDWTIIKRYLNGETSQSDLTALNTLVENHPTLKDALDTLNKSPNANGLSAATEDFDPDQAFLKLHARFKKENLI